MTADRERLCAAYVKAQTAAEAARGANAPRLARLEEQAWDAYVDECDRLEQCVHPGCYTHSPHRAYCPAHDVNPPDYGDQ